MAKKTNRKPSRMPQYMILGGIILIALVMIAFKDRNQTENTPQPGIPAATQLETALKDGKPTLAFFHSNTCEQCIIMVEMANQVYPEFSSQVVLVDIDVYDPNNEELLKQVRLQYIPTLVFFDRDGNNKPFVGVMQPEELKQQFIAISGAP